MNIPFTECLLTIMFPLPSSEASDTEKFEQLEELYPRLQMQVPFWVQTPCPSQSLGHAGLIISDTETHDAFLQALPSPHLMPSNARTRSRKQTLSNFYFIFSSLIIALSTCENVFHVLEFKQESAVICSLVWDFSVFREVLCR